MPKETEIEILYTELKTLIAHKYVNMKGFKIAPMREIDLVDYLANYFVRGIDNMASISDIITEWELVPLKSDVEIIQLFNKLRILKKT